MKFKKHLAVLLSLALSFATLTGVYAQDSGTGQAEATQQETADNATEEPKTEGEWYDSFVAGLKEAGVIDESFAVTGNITRGLFMELIVKAAEIAEAPEGYANPFTDLTEEHANYKAILAASAAGVFAGVKNADGTKSAMADTNMTREQAAAFLVRAFGAKVTGDASAWEKFTDKDSISAWARNDVGVCTSARVFNGFPDGSFGGQQTLSTAQALTMIYMCMYPDQRPAAQIPEDADDDAETDDTKTDDNKTDNTTTGSTGTTTSSSDDDDDSTVYVTSVTISQTDPLNIIIGEEVALTAQISPSSASNKKVNWSSSDEDVVEVTTAGKIKGVGAGTAVITVTTVNRAKTATITVTVADAVKITVRKDNAIWEDAEVKLIQGTKEYAATYANNTYNANVPAGTYNVYVNDINTDITATVAVNGNAEMGGDLNFYTVTVTLSGDNVVMSGVTLTATYNGTELTLENNEAIVLPGKDLVVTVNDAPTNTQYRWVINEVQTAAGNSLTVPDLSGTTTVECNVYRFS